MFKCIHDRKMRVLSRVVGQGVGMHESELTLDAKGVNLTSSS